MSMVRKAGKGKKVAATPPATTSVKNLLEPHEVVMAPTTQNAAGIQAWSQFAGEADLAGLFKGLREMVEQVQGGDMKSVEAMLCGQAMTLQTMFTSLARKAAAQEYLKQFQVNLTLALKAQAQCRATLEALVEIKNPRPVAFVKQANISGGPQQVNNGMAPPTSGGVEKSGPSGSGNRTVSHAENFSPDVNSNAAELVEKR